MARYLQGQVTVSVPATCANLGPGFDSLGLALGLRDRVTVEVIDAGEPRLEIEVVGMGAGVVPPDEGHLVYRAVSAAMARLGCEVPPLRLRCENVIPHGRGLGSSSAAIVAGICAARGLVAGGSLLMDDEAVFETAARLEGHPDNVAPALYGGFTVAYAEDDRYHATRVAVDPRVRVLVFVPPDPVETRFARGLLPATVPHADAAADAGRAALLVVALTGRPELLLAATRDYLHQDYREVAMPDSLRLVRELRGEAVPTIISGAGPAVLAFVDASNHERVSAHLPAGWQVLPLDVDATGAMVELPV
jgi:homoserine kinase